MGDDRRAIPAPELAVLRAVAAELGPRAVVEVGVGSASSALALLEAAEHRRHTCVEIDPDAPGISRLQASLDWHRVDLRLGPAELELPRLVREEARYQLALLDGRHLFDHLVLDLFMADLLLEPGGVVAVDDAHWPGLRRALLYWERNRSYQRLTGGTRRLSLLRKVADDERSTQPNTWAAIGRRFVNF